MLFFSDLFRPTESYINVDKIDQVLNDQVSNEHYIMLECSNIQHFVFCL